MEVSIYEDWTYPARSCIVFGKHNPQRVPFSGVVEVEQCWIAIINQYRIKISSAPQGKELQREDIDP